MFNNRIHFVGLDGHLWALAFRTDNENGDGWTWIDCGIPGIPLALMRPVNIGIHGVGILTVDGKFAERTFHPGLDLWEWSVSEIPEGSSIGAPPGVSYCSHDMLSPMNCVRGNKGIQTIDLTNPTSEMYKELQAFAGEVDSNGDYVLGKGSHDNIEMDAVPSGRPDQDPQKQKVKSHRKTNKEAGSGGENGLGQYAEGQQPTRAVDGTPSKWFDWLRL